MTLIEECRAALPGDWKPSPVAFILPNSQFGQSAMLGWDDLQGRPCRLRVCEVGGGVECALIVNHAHAQPSGSAAEAIAACIAQARASLGPLLPPDPIRAVAESMAGSLTGGEGRHVTEWRTPAGLLRVTVEVEK